MIVDLRDVRWIEAEGNYTRLHVAKGSWLTRRTMRDLETLLDPTRFTRVHRSHFVSLAAIRELRPPGDGDLEAVLDQGERLVVTRLDREELERRLGGIA